LWHHSSYAIMILIDTFRVFNYDSNLATLAKVINYHHNMFIGHSDVLTKTSMTNIGTTHAFIKSNMWVHGAIYVSPKITNNFMNKQNA